MRRREYYWSLYNAREKNQIDDLRTDQVEAIFAAVPQRQHADWIIWREGFSAWKPFEEFPQLLVSLRKLKEPFSLPPPPSTAQTAKATQSAQVTQANRTTSATKISKGINEIGEVSEVDIELSLVVAAPGDDRGRGRYHKKFDVRIFAGDNVFETTTIDCSVNGMKVKDPLPSGLSRYFNVELVMGDRIIPLVCSEVKSDDGKPSNRLKIEVNDHANALQTLLLAG